MLDETSGLILSIYFTFTTLSTVGYGDVTAESDIERFIVVIIMLVGVAIFSSIMDLFTNILKTYNKATAENGDSDNLTHWFGVLSKYNKGQHLDNELREEIENHFDFYWRKDKNYAAKSPEGKRFIHELPPSVMVKLYTEFLFKDFLYIFKHYLRLKNPEWEVLKNTPDFNPFKHSIFF